jgi:hypothetical protein
VGKQFDSVIPQLDHFHPYCHYATDLEHLLLLSTTLQSLRCNYDGSEHEGLAKVRHAIGRIDVKELQFEQILQFDSSDNWETDFESIEKFKKVLECKDGLNQVGLDFTFKYRQRPSEDVCNRALARWRGIKAELELICVRRGIEVMELTCHLEDSDNYHEEYIWEA